MQKFMSTNNQQNDSSVKFAELEGDFELVKNDVEHIKASVDRIDTTLKQTNSLLTNIAQIQTSQTHTENSLNTLKKDFKEYTEDNNNQIKDFSLFRTKITTSLQIITASFVVFQGFFTYVALEKLTQLSDNTTKLNTIERRVDKVEIEQEHIIKSRR
jgi:hypothetical protein